jgi:catechol 2,3-dioxygenase-like lactoylglutathione lyase family enzyme
MPIAHVTLAVRDLDRARRFFEGALGWRSIERPNNIPFPAAWLEVAPGQELHLVEREGFEPSAFELEDGRHVAVTVPADALPVLKERLKQHGAEVFAADRPTSFARFFFRSPDGYVFEVVAS